MAIDNLSEILRCFLITQGADLIGFGDVSPLLPEELKHLPNAVSIAVRLLDSVLDEIHAGPTMTYFHHYRTVNTLLDIIALKGAKYIETSGYRAMPIPASQTVDSKNHRGLFQHKSAAVRSGLGWIGRSALLVTPQHGPRVRLVTILTDAPFELTSTTLPNGCKECSNCTRSCPAGAIKGNIWNEGDDRSKIYDAHACSEHMRREYAHIGRGAVCGICVTVCPYGNNR